MIIEDKNDIDIIFFAFRYALGRNTYAPSLVIDKLKENWEDFTLSDKGKFISEIEGSVDLNCGNVLNTSDSNSIEEWDNFKIWAESSIREEKINKIVD